MFGLFGKKAPLREPIEHPELGLLEPGDDCWDVRIELGGAPVTVSIAGWERPEEQHESVRSYWRPPNAGLDHSKTIAALRIESIFIGRDGDGMIFFVNPGHFVWRCDMEGGVPQGLGFDS
jgi:hypothetical protein